MRGEVSTSNYGGGGRSTSPTSLNVGFFFLPFLLCHLNVTVRSGINRFTTYNRSGHSLVNYGVGGLYYLTLYREVKTL